MKCNVNMPQDYFSGCHLTFGPCLAIFQIETLGWLYDKLRFQDVHLENLSPPGCDAHPSQGYPSILLGLPNSRQYPFTLLGGVKFLV